MNREQIIAEAQCALRLGCSSITHKGGNWNYRKYGWHVVLAENGNLITCIDEWESFRT